MIWTERTAELPISDQLRNILYGNTHFSTNSSNNVDTKPKGKKERINVHKSKVDFMFGNCAGVAICSAFDIEYKSLKIICSMMKMDMPKGLNFFECKKTINLLSEKLNRHVDYFPNVGKMRYDQLLLAANENKFLVMFDKHLSYAENGEIFDTFYYNHISGVNWEEWIPTGWWRIK